MKSDSLHPSSRILQTFFQKFELFADATDAVPRMRELVLHLAVTGKLVPQDSNDEPAVALVARIAAALPDKKSANPFRGEIRDWITDESEYELPLGWTWLPLGHVGIWATGCGFPTQYQGKTDGEFLFCKVSDMNLPGNEVEIRTTVHSINADVMKKIRARANPVGTVIFPKIGGAIATHKRRLVVKPTIIDNNCSGIQPIGLTDERWLLMFMRSLDLTKYQSGTSVPAVSQGSLDPIRIGLPPLAEQKRIVAKVDELMTVCDRLDAQQQERKTRHAALACASQARFADAPTRANLNFLFHPSYTISPADLRKSILTLAVRGKLVPQDPNDCDARAMIDRAMEKRQQTIKTKNLRRKDIDESADLFKHADLPSSWCVERIANLVDPENTISYGVLVPGNDVPDGIPFVRAQDLCLSNHPARPNKTIAAEIEKPYARTRLTGGEILLCVVGSIGKIGVVPDSWAGANIARAVARIKPIPDVLRDYLLLVLQEQSVQNYFTSTTRTLAQPTLNVGMIEQTPIPVPPLAEQRRIVAKVEQLMALVGALEKQLATSRATAVNLLAALVAELASAPESQVTSPAPAKLVAASSRPNPQKATVAAAKPATQESTVSPSTLADLRKAAGLTQAVVAKAMGLNQAYISQMETGKRPITKEQHSNLLKIFGMIANEEQDE